MKLITTCILKSNNKVLLLRKPKRGWYAMPGGKMESGESVKESAVREFKEETGLALLQPELQGVFTFVVKDGEKVVEEWMMFTFYAEKYEGERLEKSAEGIMEWVSPDDLADKPMAEGDFYLISHILSSNAILYGTFTYTTDYRLIDKRLDPPFSS